MKVPLLDLKAQYQSIKTRIEPILTEIAESQMFILGPKVKECEEAVAAYCGAKYAVGVSSGTDALLIALMAEGTGAGAEVITTSYTYFATAGSIARVGAKPVFVDIDPVTFNIDPAKIEAKVTPRTKAIMPVHLYGQAAEMDPILAIARTRKLCVIEDAAQAIGTEIGGKRVGSLGDYGCFSFFPSKNLGCFGDGGMVTTNDPKRAEKLQWLRNHGMNPKYYHKMIGGNFRLDALQGAVVTAKLPSLDGWTAGRQRNAARYEALFAKAGLGNKVRLPAGIPGANGKRHVVNQYVVRVERRDELREFLAKADIGSEVYYPVPLHRQECFAALGYREGDLPESEKAARETLALPVYPELSEAQQQFVVQTIGAFYRAG